MSYHDVPRGNADLELGRKIYMDVLSDRRGFRDDQLGLEDPEIWAEIFEEMGKVARAAVARSLSDDRKTPMRPLKQIFCVHWFDEQPTREYGYSEGPIICTEQRTYRVTVQPRACSKCGFTEERRVGEPIYEGWN